MTCAHTQGYRFHACSAADRLPGVWECKICGSIFKTNPVIGLTYTEGPSPHRVWKDPPKMISHETDNAKTKETDSS